MLNKITRTIAGRHPLWRLLSGTVVALFAIGATRDPTARTIIMWVWVALLWAVASSIVIPRIERWSNGYKVKVPAIKRKARRS